MSIDYAFRPRNSIVCTPKPRGGRYRGVLLEDGIMDQIKPMDDTSKYEPATAGCLEVSMRPWESATKSACEVQCTSAPSTSSARMVRRSFGGSPVARMEADSSAMTQIGRAH